MNERLNRAGIAAIVRHEAADRILLDPREAAAMLAISPRKLWDLTHRYAEIPYVKIGKLVRYRRRDIEVWIDGRINQKVENGQHR